MALLPVADARQSILSNVSVLPEEIVPLVDAHLRVSAAPLSARRTQPPFATTAMDGYAVRHADLALDQDLELVGEAPAGHRFKHALLAGQTVRIFTGAPLPEGADTILIQEDATVRENGKIRPLDIPQKSAFVRPAGLDFKQGAVLIEAGSTLRAADLALLASMNYAEVPVVRKPRIGVLATGDELAMPGAHIGVDQIVASNNFGVAARIAELGGQPVDLGIAKDTEEDLLQALKTAEANQCDAIITLGGASVGTHDLVQQAFHSAGLSLSFWKIAMRPGKPLMFGTVGGMLFLGFPGNPVSSMVCGELFMAPLIKTWLGQPSDIPLRQAALGDKLSANDQREDYLRAILKPAEGLGQLPTVHPLSRQDSSMLASFAKANCLIRRAPFATEADQGTIVDVLMLRSD
ncbi:gephyrin-like molybdotransferase Glp [Pararhizobium sp. IMCC21322]|uniref:molybdopterin molybdotransferase MoeA n=1 Tax=Pararhizobium sp. IMCC21322 TaxID=3067903 RepID=UPI0027427BBB|nr:gephyrin-like molybdotransferase Glp [Pararhizobium sp. IMCC21322]